MGSQEDDIARAIDECVYRAVREVGGSISAEHGIGVSRAPYIGWTRSAEELQLMRTLKRALDPANLLNPGKIARLQGVQAAVGGGVVTQWQARGGHVQGVQRGAAEGGLGRVAYRQRHDAREAAIRPVTAQRAGGHRRQPVVARRVHGGTVHVALVVAQAQELASILQFAAGGIQLPGHYRAGRRVRGVQRAPVGADGEAVGDVDPLDHRC
ncbi:hypothetical protein E4634_20985, partial [Mangrovimicrobium sediminis]